MIADQIAASADRSTVLAPALTPMATGSGEWGGAHRGADTLRVRATVGSALAAPS